jgi:zinc and cadmium transporter
MNGLILTLISTLFISLASLLGIFTLSLKKEKLERFLLFFVSLSAGGMMGGAFLHLLPEALESISAELVFFLLLLSFSFFFILEKLLHWRHCHMGFCEVHTFGYLNLLGDSLHNFIDGFIIAGAFKINANLGLATSLAVFLHEVPQEIGDFGVLLYAGFKRKKALLANLLVALTAVLGGILGWFLIDIFKNLAFLLMPVAAGGFLYISSSDLIPEIRKEKNLKKSFLSFALFLLGLLLMYLLKII